MGSPSRETRRGLTLVEVLVTVVLASIMVAGVYLIYSRSVLAFRVENQVMTLQDRLRFGLEHLKRDVRRAGFLATPNSLVDANICPPPTYHLRAVTLATASGDVWDPDSNENVAPTAITLFGDFFSGQVYRTSGIVGNRVYFQGTANFPGTELEFNRIFCGPTCNAPNRYLRIVTQDQFEVMLPITDVEWEGPTGRYVVLSEDVPRVGGSNRCGISGLGEGLEVNVAGFVRYRIAFDTRPSAPVDPDSGDPVKTDLVREELDIDGQTELDGTQLVVADYAVDLQFYDFGFDVSAPGVAPQMVYISLITDVMGTGSQTLAATADANPEDLRVLTLKLTLRSDEEDSNFPFTPRPGPFTPLEGYELDPQIQGASRTLSMACKVGLSSLLARNLSPGGS
ncbi:MAG: prepilin-type N-terminal cleavage/methylation domain-containing protein [Deltaproteobacteria bacterium]|nr:prepilin-type N-terminal cleavage/methylation domain-containing protein [Deltaproteobacteria bacterium]